jgi:hypothetical protein
MGLDPASFVHAYALVDRILDLARKAMPISGRDGILALDTPATYRIRVAGGSTDPGRCVWPEWP